MNFRMSFIEIFMSLILFSLILAIAFSFLNTSQDVFISQSAISNATENARIAMDKLVSELTQTSLSTIDTTFRPNSPTLKWSNHYQETLLKNKYCSSSTCLWNTAGGQALNPLSRVSWNYGVDGLGKSFRTKQGRIWLDFTGNSCPLDGSLLLSYCFLDGIKFFSPYNRLGETQVNPITGKLRWQSIVFYFPYRKAEAKTFELRRYVVYLNDLFQPLPIPAEITLGSLWDLNGDGRIDDVDAPKIAEYDPNVSSLIKDYFYVQEEFIYWSKHFNTLSIELQIHRASGETTWKVNGPLGLTREASFQRNPQTIVHGLLDLDISTKNTNPFDALTQAGLENNTVQITMVFSFSTVKERERPSEFILSTQVSPRN
jgi:type II secretory pathway pseudopilin PulG